MKEGKKEALYGEQTRLTLSHMTYTKSRLCNYPEYICSLAEVKKACALANCMAKELEVWKKDLIVNACDEVICGKWLEQFPVDVFHGGGGIGINMNINEVISSLCEEKVDPIDDINKNQSTSDVCHTTLRITLVRECRKLYKEINQMIEVLSAKAFEFSSIQTIARTCLQDGMSIPVSSIFEGMAAALLRQRQRLEYCIEELHCINLGWTVVGSGTGASEEYRRHIICQLQAVTKMDVQWRECSYDAAQYPDDLVFTAQEIFNIISICAKFARDLRLLSSGPETGFREIKIPATQKGSSFFPGKVNPVIPEMLIQCQMLVKGNTSVIEEGLGLGEIHINLWEELMGFLLLDNLHMVTNSMNLFRIHCIEGIEVNEEVCESYARSSIPTVVNCKEKLGYQRTTQLIKELGLEEFVKRYR